MNYIWLLQRLSPKSDEVAGMVVCAPTAAEARSIAGPWCGDEGPSEWTTALYSTCKRMGTAMSNISGVLLRSFNTG